jgi:DNA polymerase beta
MYLTLKKLNKNKFKHSGGMKNKTLKHKDKTINTTINKTMEEKTNPTTNPTTIYNEKLINLMEELNAIMTRKGEHFRARAYKKAEEELIKYTKNKGNISSLDQIKDLPNIGKTILEKFNEYIKTGTLKILEEERNNPFHLFTKIYGVGPKKADDLIKQKITSIKELQEEYTKNPKVLNDKQAIGLKYYDAINERIPRQEIEDYEKQLKELFKKATPAHSSFEIVGSYRRGAETSGDIDIIITNKNNNHKAYDNFLDALTTEKIIIETLSHGEKKSLTIAQLTPKSKPRRVDFLYTPQNEYSFAILYFTGSKMFNTIMRQHALEMGYTLNEHGISIMHQKVKGEMLDNHDNKRFPDEESIFRFLNMKYKKPSERINNDSVELISESETSSSSSPILEEAKEAKEAKEEAGVQDRRGRLVLRRFH